MTPSKRFLAAIDASDARRVEYEHNVPLPGTVPPSVDGHLVTWHKIHEDTEAGVRATVKLAVAMVRLAVQERRASAADFVPLPHIPDEVEHIEYHPATIDGIPVRVMMSYSHVFGAYQAVIDAQIRE